MITPDRLNSRAMIAGPFTPERVADLIRAGLPGATVRVESDDNTHFAALVVSTEFGGKRPIARHQLVYKALGELMGREIHALSITALTPEEMEKMGAAPNS
jgi:acid stress-induced BolA-like protein IbaG/YrbA